MYHEPSYDHTLAPAVLAGPAPMSSLALSGSDKSKSRAASAYSLEDILRLMDILSVRIARYTILRTTPNRPSSAESAVDDEALAWMLTSLEDIAATLIGISTCPREGA